MAEGEGAGGAGSTAGSGELEGQQRTVKVVCNGVPALFLLDDANFICQCPSCLRRAEKGGPQVYTPTEYERHAGMAASKKWKYSVRIDDLELNPDGGILTIGKWLDDQGLTQKKRPAKGGRGGPQPSRLGTSRPPSSTLQLSRPKPTLGSWAGANDGTDTAVDGLYRQAPPAWPHFGGRSGIPLNTEYLTPNSKEKRRWLMTQEQVAEQEGMDPRCIDVPTTPVQHKVSRVGDAYQASLPALSKHSVKSAEDHDRWLGNPGPSEAEALAIASAVEKVYANSMPRDAVADVHEEEEDPQDILVPDVKPELLDRKQRVRRRPQWLSGNVNLYGIRRRRRSERHNQLQEMDEQEIAVEPDLDDESMGGKGTSDGGLGDVGSKDALRVPRMKRSRNMIRATSAANIASGGDVEAGIAVAEPEILHCQTVGGVGSLFLTIRANGLVYRGELPLDASLSVQPNRKLQQAAGMRSSGPCSEASMDVLDSQAGSQFPDGGEYEEVMGRGDEEAGDRAGVSGKRQRTMVSSRTDDFGDTEDVEMGAASQGQPLSKRHVKAEERYQKLAEEGAPPDTLCSLCLLEEDEQVDYDGVDGMAPAHRFLGKLLLVRTSTITHAWVHESCAMWCPEVREVAPRRQRQDGSYQSPVLEGLTEAVRRGRRIKCTECGQRGATLGCHAKNCRRSYHLPCACVAGCLLEDDTMASFCNAHAELHLRAREEAARSAEKPSRAKAPLRSLERDDTSTEVAKAAEEDELAATILLGAMQHNSSEAKAPSHSYSQARNSGGSRPPQAASSLHSRARELLLARRQSEAAKPSPSQAHQQPGTHARKSVATADVKPLVDPSSRGQKPRTTTPKPASDSVSAKAPSQKAADGAAAPQRQQPTPNSSHPSLYPTSVIPPAPVRSKRMSHEGPKTKGLSSALDRHAAPSTGHITGKPVHATTQPLPSSTGRTVGMDGQQPRSMATSHKPLGLSGRELGRPDAAFFSPASVLSAPARAQPFDVKPQVNPPAPLTRPSP